MIHIIITCRKSEPKLVRSFLCGVKHIFYNKHQTYNGYTTLYPDYDMAVAWNRIYNGNPLERDILLLHHELLECTLEREYNLTIAEAHKLAQETYHWVRTLREETGGEGEELGLL